MLNAVTLYNNWTVAHFYRTNYCLIIWNYCILHSHSNRHSLKYLSKVFQVIGNRRNVCNFLCIIRRYSHRSVSEGHLMEGPVHFYLSVAFFAGLLNLHGCGSVFLRVPNGHDRGSLLLLG
jgi:hypothetical protein